jgi:sphinganine C4-monooxygenase
MLLVPSSITPWKVSLEVPLGVPSFLVAGMTPHTTPRTSIFFFSFATVKSVDVHCRLWLPGNPVHLIFHNTAYDDIHHQLSSKYSYSQPFFVTWDKLLGTSIPFVLQKRADGRFEPKALCQVGSHDHEN